jgi:hypothetical protein
MRNAGDGRRLEPTLILPESCKRRSKGRARSTFSFAGSRWQRNRSAGIPISTIGSGSIFGHSCAEVLRDKPNIHCRKDRGRDVPSAPWYQKFNGEQINDHTLTLAKKQAAREVAATCVA